MNVLLTAVGRRGYLVRAFRKALRGRGRVLAANTRGDVSGMLEADDALVVPPSHDPAYLDRLESVCREREVGLVLSFHDLDTVVLARHRGRLEAAGADVLVPDAAWADICLDKHRTAEVLGAAGLPVPWHTLDRDVARGAVGSGRVGLPLVVKPRHGFGSLATCLCEDPAELDWLAERVGREAARSPLVRLLGEVEASAVLFQECVTGAEHCLDLVHDLAGRPAAAMACRVDVMRAGESDVATTVPSAVLGDLPARLSALTRHRGIWGVDIMVDGDRARILDINPRFTGDYAFQHLAGADVPAALVAWKLGEAPEPAWLSPATGVTGCKDLVPVRVPG